ncbi:MAG: hypothetical protein JRJ29_01035 [Deltaproteobacteria bacterium]|nr:hypothetical protein [Deltaproteobacteria bacterium]
MRWLETVLVQVGGDEEKNAENQVRELACKLLTKPGCSGLVTARVYRHALITGAFALQLLWDTDKLQPYGSHIGLGFKETMEKRGIVDHKIWIEMKGEKYARHAI